MKIALIDADVLLYQIAHNTSTVAGFDDVYYWTGDLKMAMDRFRGRTREVINQLDADRAILCFSDHSNEIFRMEFFPDYKANRRRGNAMLKAPHFHVIKQRLLGVPENPNDSFRCKGESVRNELEWADVIAEPRLEADDLMGIYASRDDDNEYVVCSIDKDLMMIPGAHLNLDSMKETVVHPDQGRAFFEKQILTGDSTDGIPGLKGCGPKGADKILEADLDVPVMERIEAAFVKKGGSRDDLILNARLVYILRDTDYDFDTKEVSLWQID